jgi:hypothetical protein
MSASRNNITGDVQASRPATDAYRDNYDVIFGKKESATCMSSMVLVPSVVAEITLERIETVINGASVVATMSPPLKVSELEYNEFQAYLKEKYHEVYSCFLATQAG